MTKYQPVAHSCHFNSSQSLVIAMPDSIADTTICTVPVSSDDSVQEELSGLKELLENLKLSGVFCAIHVLVYLY